MLYGLKNQVIEKINQIFARYRQVEKVILYGSRAIIKKGQTLI
jgi:hypothetical protein